MENLKADFNRWVEAEDADFRDRYSERFPTSHPDELAVRVPKRFHPLLAHLEPQIISRGQYLTEGLWFFPTDGEVLKLSYND